MRKGILSLFLLLIICMGGCNASESDESEGMEKSAVDMSKVSSEVIMKINEEKISEPYPERITLSYNNNSDKEYYYGTGASLEKKINNEWYEVPFSGNYAFKSVAIHLPGHSMKEDSFNLMGYLDNFNTGEYRIVKRMREHVQYEFSSADVKLAIATGKTISAPEIGAIVVFGEFMVE